MKMLVAQTRAEIVMTLRRGETLLLTIGIPVLLLVFFTTTHVTSAPAGPRINFLTPGILALCVMSTSLVALSIATGFERSYGVLRRLHVTPLGRPRLIGAKTLGVLFVEIIQTVVIVAVAYALGWSPACGAGAIPQGILAGILATAGFCGIGLFLAGRLKAEVNLAAANGLYLVLLLVSGFVIPTTSFPAAVRDVLVATPSGAFADALHRLFSNRTSMGWANLISLSVWALLAPVLAARTFRYD